VEEMIGSFLREFTGISMSIQGEIKNFGMT
jgi:hypothetical protein